MDFRVDRSLAMPVRAQLKGAIEFGISFGELTAGDALPSVRKMATLVGVAPMTVTQVYRKLKADGLVEARKGAGTFIADSSQARAAQHSDIDTLHWEIDQAIDKALELGISAVDFATIVKMRLDYRSRIGPRMRFVMAGLFPDATESYCRLLSEQLDAQVLVEGTTLEALRHDPDVRAFAASSDCVVTFTNRHRELKELMPSARVVTIRFIPSETTRMQLASLMPTARLLVLSQFPNFIPIFRSAMRRFAAHVTNVTTVNYDDPKVEDYLKNCDAVIYATGTDRTAERARPGTFMFEYRHVPDPADIDRVLKPLLERPSLK
ncbi:GntR family transcriptional regulator [Breoghania sp.]|uniref:GntR family transcriptional regulator n=1 Tax=Breoghania sp. TaxID=2065378 RepID=UPI00260BE3AA|nr:GntR family transcriptional regulator [Breoghania sp.]MDJ0933587.1 GntR family transcriptional regulator [Breoghania sp.]